MWRHCMLPFKGVSKKGAHDFPGPSKPSQLFPQRLQAGAPGGRQGAQRWLLHGSVIEVLTRHRTDLGILALRRKRDTTTKGIDLLGSDLSVICLCSLRLDALLAGLDSFPFASPSTR